MKGIQVENERGNKREKESRRAEREKENMMTTPEQPLKILSMKARQKESEKSNVCECTCGVTI